MLEPLPITGKWEFPSWYMQTLKIWSNQQAAMNQTVERVLPIPIKNINLVFLLSHQMLWRWVVFSKTSHLQSKEWRGGCESNLCLNFWRQYQEDKQKILLSHKDNLHRQKQAGFQRSDRVLDLRWFTSWWLKNWLLQSQRPLSFLGKVSRRCPSKM